MGNQMQPHRFGIKESKKTRRCLSIRMHLPLPEVASKQRSPSRRNKMHRSSKKKAECGWESNADEYLAHLIRMERALSITPGAPHYPDVHKAFNHKSPYEESEEKPSKQLKSRKVSFQDQQGNGDNSQGETDDERSNSGQRKPSRGFELCKWKTFKE